MSVLGHHVSVWGSDPHDAEGTGQEFIVESAPHHHHYNTPGEWKKRQDNWDVWTLEEAFAFVAEYIRTGKAYVP